MDRYFGCSFFTTFFLREKESGGKKSAYKGDCAAIRYAPIRRSLPLIYPPDDCSADSDLASYRPKCSASIMPRVSYFENARIKLGFFPYGKYAHPMPQKILLSNIQMRLLFAHPHLQEMVRIPRLWQYRFNSVTHGRSVFEKISSCGKTVRGDLTIIM